MQYLYYLKAAFATDPITKACAAVICTFFFEVVGVDYVAYQVLFILVVLDAITGFWVGCREKKISSKRFFDTGRKLLVYFILIIASHQVVRISDLMSWMDESMALFLASTEILSLLENCHHLGVNVPKWMVNKLEKYNHHNGEV